MPPLSETRWRNSVHGEQFAVAGRRISSTIVSMHQFIVGHIRHSSLASVTPLLVNFNGGVRHLPERLTA